MIFSCIIPAKDVNDPKLADLIRSIQAQDFPQDQIEIIVVTEGDSEQAKAIGIRRAQGEICAMFCTDNYVHGKDDFSTVKMLFGMQLVTGIYSKFYSRNKFDGSLNRYFSLMGCNDPIAFYLGKADRKPWYYEADEPVVLDLVFYKDAIPSLGDNGFYVRREHILKADLDHYYPMDAFEDLRKQGMYAYLRTSGLGVWHRTSDDLFTFLQKRYRYARDLYCDRTDRRWKMLSTRKDYWRLAGFCLATATIIPCIWTSIRGFLKVRDFAWFWHWPVCVGFLITYGALACRNLLKFRSLFQRSIAQAV